MTEAATRGEPAATLEGRLDAAAAAVAEARRRIARGEGGHPEALARVVGEALGLAGAVPPRAEATRTQPFMLALLDETERLLEVVEREHAAAAMRLRELATRDRAGRAYGGRW